jgi:hypothetical protein
MGATGEVRTPKLTTSRARRLGASRATGQRFGPQTSESLGAGGGDRASKLKLLSGRSSGERRSWPGVGDFPSHSKENDHAAPVTRATGERPRAEDHHEAEHEKRLVPSFRL